MEATQDAETIHERKERKKLQNRLNQRARRNRLKEDKTDKKADRPYEVDRWRLHYSNGEATEKQLVIRRAKPDAAAERDDDASKHRTARAPASSIFGSFVDPIDMDVCICSARAAIIKGYSASVTADQLLELIQFNVFRALIANKYSMSGKAQHYQEAADGPLIPYLEQTYPGNAVFVPLSAGELPVSLLPTQLQITVQHATWIDLLPFPRMRDNLIRAHNQFDHAELVNDVIGQLIDLSQFFRPQGHVDKASSQASSRGEGSPESLEDEATAPPRGGFIVYGAPHRVESWEVTPEFVWKWGWTLMGCQELMESTNRWRRSRGESVLPMIITRPWHNNSLGLAGVSA
ncbi:unnamed protein product [Clonostachys rosea]|uniref:BZIP domain-containing protein n=1 Tax=Bionectria ochroleuca TaxID=29856 RepID=A0ABY6V2K2_BIOOC|nr:unnamed protein product [Clonostachys rosea]